MQGKCCCLLVHNSSPKTLWYKHKQYMSRIYTVLQATSAHGLLLPLLGLRSKGLLQAVIQPLLLTASLFMGPLLQSVLSGRPDGDSIVPLQTLRNLVMAPITEEFCFRACMAPLFLLQVTCFLSYMSTGKLQHCCWFSIAGSALLVQHCWFSIAGSALLHCCVLQAHECIVHNVMNSPVVSRHCHHADAMQVEKSLVVECR